MTTFSVSESFKVYTSELNGAVFGYFIKVDAGAEQKQRTRVHFRLLFLFFSGVPPEERVFTVLKWLQLPDDERLVGRTKAFVCSGIRILSWPLMPE